MDIINVIEMVGKSNMSVNSFIIMENSVRRDNDKNKKIEKAENLFVKMGGENGMIDSDIDYCLENGYFENGDYRLFLIWSE